MGNADTKLNFRKAVIQLTTKQQPVEPGDESFWAQFWSDSVTCVQDVFTLIPAAEIRALREESPSNLATLCYKAVEKLVQAAENGCGTTREVQTVLNCVRLLTRILPYIFEDPDWRGFFWSTLPGQAAEEVAENESPPLAQSLLNALSDLLFCPDFTVASNRKTGPDNPEDIHTIDSCEYIWEAGVGFAHSPPHNLQYDSNRAEILKLMLTCFSETMYLPPVADAHLQPNQWIAYFTSTENRHALPLFTSFINTICAYDPVGYGVPYNHLMFADAREPLVEASLQVLCVTLDNDANAHAEGAGGPPIGEQQTVDDHIPTGMPVGTAIQQSIPTEPTDVSGPDNLFNNYMSRIHREEDFAFILKGLTRLLNNPLIQTYLPGSCKKVQFHQELLVLFWRMCDINKKFMFYVLKSSDVLDILVPILFHLNDARADQSRVGLMHIGVFILLLLSGERNFGVRLNKPYTVRVPMDIPVFTGTHADFLIIVFHKIITTGHQRLQPLFDCLLTIIVNISPYLKTLSMVASTKLLHLLEAFSTPWFLYSSPTNHHLVFFLLEVFNNIIQYQFDGNANMVYTIIRKRNVFHQLANLPVDHHSIARALTKRGRGKIAKEVSTENNEESMEGSTPATEAEPGTLKVTLAATPVLPNTIKTVEEKITMGQDSQGEGAFNPDQITESSSKDHDDPWCILKQAFQPSSQTIHSVQPANRMVDSQYLNVPPVKPRTKRRLQSRLIKSHSLPNYSAIDSDDESQSSDDDVQSVPDKCLPQPPPEPPKPTIMDLALQEAQHNHDSELKSRLAQMLACTKVIKVNKIKGRDENSSRVHSIENMTEKSPASAAHSEQQSAGLDAGDSARSVQPDTSEPTESRADNVPDGQSDAQPEGQAPDQRPPLEKANTMPELPSSPTESAVAASVPRPPMLRGASVSTTGGWVATSDWVQSWKQKLPLQTIMRLLQVLVPQVEKICIDKGLTDESEILKFLQHGTLVGLLPVPHPILIRKYQANSGTTMWFRTYMWGVIYLRNVDPPVWYDTDVKLFEIQRV